MCKNLMKTTDPSVFFLAMFLRKKLKITKMKKTVEGQWGKDGLFKKPCCSF